MTAPCVISAGTVLEDFADYTQWTQDTGAYAPKASYISETIGKIGVQLSLQATAASTTYYFYTKTINQSFNVYKASIELRVFTHAGSVEGGAARLSVELSSTTNWSKKFSYVTTYCLKAGWTHIRIIENEWTNTGGESWSNTMLRLRIGAKPLVTGMMPKIDLDSLIGGIQTTPAVCLSFYDTFRTHVTDCLPLVAARGWKASFGIDPSDLWSDTRYTQEDIDALKAAGWWPFFAANQVETLNMDGYGYSGLSHTSVTIMGARVMDAAITANLHYFMTHGYGGSGSVFIGGGGNVNRDELQELYRVLEKHHCKMLFQTPATALTTSPGYTLNAHPIDDPYRVAQFALGGETLATAKSYVDWAVSHGQMVNFDVQQLVASSPGTWDWLASDYVALLDYIESLGVAVMTFPEWYAFAADFPVYAPTLDYPAHVTLGNINLNDQINYFVDSVGMNLGQPQTTWEETVSYSGAINQQINVSRKSLVMVTIPMWVVGTSISNLSSLLNALWVEVDKASNTLAVDGEIHNIVYSTRPETLERDNVYENQYRAYFTLTLMRTP